MESLLVAVIVLLAVIHVGRQTWQWLQPLLLTAKQAAGPGHKATPIACAGCPQRTGCSSASRAIPSQLQR